MLNNNENNRVNDQIKQQQINNQLEQRSNLSKGMESYQHYKKNYANSSLNDNKRMKNQLNNHSKKMGSSLDAINSLNRYASSNNSIERDKAKADLKGNVANMAATAATGSKTLGNLAEKAVKMKDKLNPLKAAKNAILGKINGDDQEEYDELGNPKQQENRLENVSFTIPPKVIKWGVIAGVPSFVAIIFICLFISASQTYVNILGIDSADQVTEKDLEETEKDENWHEEEGATDPDEIEAYNYNRDSLLVDNFIEENNNQNIILMANERQHEAELEDINDYFSQKLKCEGEACKKEPEYLFYLKMHDIYYLYKTKYKVILDLPLLMSTLSIGDEQIVNIFEMNSKNFTLKDHEINLDYINKCKEGECPSNVLNIDPAYDFKNLDGYLYLSSSDFSYDMQILAQNMVVSNGNGYKKDLSHFDEFLDQYIEYKFYLSDDKKKELYGVQDNNNSTVEVDGDYANWKQCSSEWGQVKIGNSNICNVGCYITSIAIQIVRSGTKLTVAPFNPTVIAKYGSFSLSGSLNNPNFSGYAPNFSCSSRVSLLGLSKAKKIEKVKKELDKGNYPIIHLSRGHFVAVQSVTNNEIIMNDPGNNGSNLFATYGLSEVDRMVVCKKSD